MVGKQCFVVLTNWTVVRRSWATISLITVLKITFIFQQILASEVHSALILSQTLVSDSSMNVHNVYNEYYVAWL